MEFALTSAWDLSSAALRVPTGGMIARNGLKDAANRVFARAEETGLMPPLPVAFDSAYEDYPELRVFERDYTKIRAECQRVLAVRDRMPDVSALVGGYTAGRGVHVQHWRALMLKAGGMVRANARLCPHTAQLVAALPDVYTAFFSILEPGQYLPPHWGYFKGFLRYHLGVIIPDNNRHEQCWLRINKDPRDNAARDKSAIERGEKYYWKNGRGVMFDDTRLHDAYNGSNEVRVVLFMDVLRKLPRGLSAYRRACMLAASLEPSVRRLRERALLAPSGARARPMTPSASGTGTG